VPAGEVLLGEDGADKPGKRVKVAAFRIDRHEVTNRQFAAFVAATGYRTEAEIQGAGAVFVVPSHLDGLADAAQWWKLTKGAFWRSPAGPGSGIAGRMDDPVVQVTYADAQAYARWAGRDLPDEAQWERAARGAQAGTAPPSSWAYDGQGRPIANTWQGAFPVADAGEDGYRGLAPVGCFKPNDFGLYDMIGNAWEWTSQAQAGGSSRIVKGGSFLCSFDYCANFRPAGWQAQEADLPTSHIGFRTVARRRRAALAPHGA
jgi:formylglycine-generating enzyme required for sulfatase activity